MTGEKNNRSPRSGDRVRAVTDDRDGDSVEGILYLRHVPSLDYAQVGVLTGTELRIVVPDSIEVLECDEISREELERGDPLVGEPGRRWITDVAEAGAAGLIEEPRHRVGGTWDEMFEQLADLAKPMLDAGWRIVSTYRDESWEFGDSVFYELERKGELLELEYYEHGQLVAYPIDHNEDGDDPTEPIFSIPESTADSALETFREHGWV